MLPAQRLQLLLHVGVSRLRRRDLDTQRAVPGDGRPRPDRYHSIEGEVALLVPTGDLDLRRVDGVHVVVDQRTTVVVGKRLLDRLLASGGHADAGLQELAGGLSGSESGEADLLGDSPEGRLHGDVELGLSDGDSQPDQVAVQSFKGGLHSLRSVPAAP